MALPALPVLVVVGAGPGRGGERAEGPAQQGLAQEAVAGPAGDDDAGAAGGLGDRRGAGVGLQGGRGREPLAAVADLAEHPGGEACVQPGQAQQDLAVRVGSVA